MIDSLTGSPTTDALLVALVSGLVSALVTHILIRRRDREMEEARKKYDAKFSRFEKVLALLYRMADNIEGFYQCVYGEYRDPSNPRRGGIAGLDLLAKASGEAETLGISDGKATLNEWRELMRRFAEGDTKGLLAAAGPWGLRAGILAGDLRLQSMMRYFRDLRDATVILELIPVAEVFWTRLEAATKLMGEEVDSALKVDLPLQPGTMPKETAERIKAIREEVNQVKKAMRRDLRVSLKP